MIKPVRFEKIFYPSDFSNESHIAFVHALKIALKSRAFLQMMHADVHNQADWDDFPSVRETLKLWKVLPEESSRRMVTELGFEISKAIATSNDPVRACLDYFEVNEVDLIVLSVHQRQGMMRWLGKIVGEKISYGSKQATLFLPAGQEGFVSAETGSVNLKNVLIPIVNKPRPESGIEFTERLIKSLELEAGTVTLLHVGQTDTMPSVDCPYIDGWKWNSLRREGERTDTIVQVAEAIDADMIVMTTDGPDRFLDGLRGTTSERVLRKACCAVAVVPVEPMQKAYTD